MGYLKSKLPEIDALQAGLKSALEAEGLHNGDLTIVDRRPNVQTSTFPSEVVTCLTDNGTRIQLLCKYSNHLIESYGHRGGVEYEAKVYRWLLNNIDLSVAGFFGEYQQQNNNQICLIMEFLDNSERVNKTRDREGMIDAARWIGKFHAIGNTMVESPNLSFIRRYDADYYAGWASRTFMNAKQIGLEYKWLDTVCERFDEVIAILSAGQNTIIHGEYYPKNILFHENTIYPVDWESTAVAMGEIDLASLTQGWPADDIRNFTIEYKQARWPGGVDYDFRRTMCAARIYLYCRWLGDRKPRTAKAPYRFEKLHKSAEEFGLL